jgi:hypothetical protein
MSEGYKSPIEIITTGVHLLVEENVYKTVTKLGINVDKDELLRALQYDREQYQKGYDDGCKEAIKEFAERLKDYLRKQPKWSCRREKYDNVGFSYDDVFFGIDKVVKEMVGDDNAR